MSNEVNSTLRQVSNEAEKVCNEVNSAVGKVSNEAHKGRPKRETKETKACLIRQLDEVALGFHLCRYHPKEQPGGWMRAVRLATGLPVEELARRMGVSRGVAFRLEKSERDGRIQMSSLKRAAEAMGCELVYAIIPRVGSIGAMAARQRAEDEAARELAREGERKPAEWKGQARAMILRSAKRHDLPLKAISR